MPTPPPPASTAPAEPAIGSATSTVGGPARAPDAGVVAGLKQPSVQALAARQAATDETARAMPVAGHKLADHVNAEKTDFLNARRCINGTDKQHEIAGIANKYLAQL